MHSVSEELAWPPSGRQGLPFAGCENGSTTTEDSGVRAGNMLRILKGLWLGLAVLAGGCTGVPEPSGELHVGSPAPEVMQVVGRSALVIAGSVDDCLSCDLRGLFVALRALQHSHTAVPAPAVLFLAVSDRVSDTLYFRQTLRRERVEGSITAVPPRAVSTLFVADRLPAMYLLNHGVIVAAWEPSLDHRIVAIERDELLALVEGLARLD